MADMINVGSAWLEAQRKSFLSRSVTYTRGAYSVSVAASAGKTVFQIDDGYGAIISVTSQDFIILAADLILNGVVVVPQRGDKIVDTQGGVLTYEVCAPGKEPDWRYSDNYQRSLRIHSKLIGSV